MAVHRTAVHVTLVLTQPSCMPPPAQVKEEEMRQQLAKGTPRGEGEALLAWHSPACCTHACSFDRMLHPSLLAAA